jgi:DNA polymerase III subunit gamma/tau
VTSAPPPASPVALYRKYRSATFAELIGQEHVTAPLSQALTTGRINHAYLFSGPRGCGKTSSARILARSLNCAQGPTATPCGVCDSCRELAPNGPGSIDVIEIDAASHGGVDDARDLRERAFFAPVRDRFKVYIIDEAHMVTTQGFNALLKLVEEPPDFLVFVFATTEPDKVLTTIRSRTHHYPFRLIPPSAMRAHLERICLAEGITVEPAVLPLVVRAGGGSARDSLSILDQLLAGAGTEGVTYARAVGLLGVTDDTLLGDMIDALAVGDATAVYSTVDRVVEAGHDPRRFAVDLLDRFRDLIVLDAVPDAAERALIDAPQDTLAHMGDQAARIGGATLTRYAEIVHTALIEMRGTTSPRLVLELLCARMQLPDAATDSASLLQRIERLERRQSIAQSGAPETVPEPAPAPPPPAPSRRTPPTPPVEREPAPAPEPTPPPAAPGTLDATALRRVWDEILDKVKTQSGGRSTRALLDNAQISRVDGDRLVLAITTPQLAKMLAEARNSDPLKAALTLVVGGTWRVDVEVAPTGVAEPAEPAAEPTPPPPRPVVPRPEPPRPAEEREKAKAPDLDPREDTDEAAQVQADPEADALDLLRSTFGARPIED